MTFDPNQRAQLREKFAEFAQTGDRDLRDQLVRAHLGLAEYLARRFANRGEPLDDLVQVASLGLLKAVEQCMVGHNLRTPPLTHILLAAAETSSIR